MPTLLERALIATRASRRIELKETFDPDKKDVAALANSGGGVVLFGVDRRGEPTGAPLPSTLPPRTIETVKFGKRVLAMTIEEAPTPIVCDGVVYVRRGARTVPATTEELAKIVDRRVEAARREWLGAVRRVVREPDAPVAVRVVDDKRAPAYR